MRNRARAYNMCLHIYIHAFVKSLPYPKQFSLITPPGGRASHWRAELWWSLPPSCLMMPRDEWPSSAAAPFPASRTPCHRVRSGDSWSRSPFVRHSMRFHFTSVYHCCHCHLPLSQIITDPGIIKRQRYKVPLFGEGGSTLLCRSNILLRCTLQCKFTFRKFFWTLYMVKFG